MMEKGLTVTLSCEEIIHVFEKSQLVSEHFTADAVTAAYVAGLAALHAQQEMETLLKERDTAVNDPLTLEDLKEMNGEPVWKERPGHDGRWVLVDCFWSREGVIYLRNIGGSSELADIAFREGARIYRHRPEEEAP